MVMSSDVSLPLLNVQLVDALGKTLIPFMEIGPQRYLECSHQARCPARPILRGID